MKDLGMKQNVLKEIMDLMDVNEGNKLKKHPKFAKATVIEIAKKPEVDAQESKQHEAMEMPMMEKGEQESGEEELSPEMIQALLEQLQKEKE